MPYQVPSQDARTAGSATTGSTLGIGALRQLISSASASNDALDRLILSLYADVGRLTHLSEVLPHLAPGSNPISAAMRTAYNVELETEWHDNQLGSLRSVAQSFIADGSDAERVELETMLNDLIRRAANRASDPGLRSLLHAARSRARSNGRVLEWQDFGFPERSSDVDVALDAVLRISSAPWPSTTGPGREREEGSVVEWGPSSYSAPWPVSDAASGTTSSGQGARAAVAASELQSPQNSAPWPTAGK